MQLEDFGLTARNAGDSFRDAAAITAAGFLTVTALGYLSGFKALQIDAQWLMFYVMIMLRILPRLKSGVS